MTHRIHCHQDQLEYPVDEEYNLKLIIIFHLSDTTYLVHPYRKREVVVSLTSDHSRQMMAACYRNHDQYHRCDS